jgi:hypothetical protein
MVLLSNVIMRRVCSRVTFFYASVEYRRNKVSAEDVRLLLHCPGILETIGGVQRCGQAWRWSITIGDREVASDPYHERKYM